jgi:ribonuclease HIII
LPFAGDAQVAVVGLDEAGKGDYFGPLVVAAVCGAPQELAALGVADSKKVTDRRCALLAAEIGQRFPVEVVAVGPERYNELYSKMKNLNRLLAWAHARALENLLARVPVETVVADQFADAKVLAGALLERGARVQLIQAPRAESHPTVAAASMVARAEFVSRLAELGRRHGCTLPKGAGAPVDQAGIELYRKGGLELLTQIAKLHFRTSQKIGVPAVRPA